MLKNVLIVVDDIEKSIEFYRDLFGLQVILKNEGNVILSEGLVFPCKFMIDLVSIRDHSPGESIQEFTRMV